MFEIIVQSLIIAAIVAGATGYVSGKIMEVKINGLREAVKRLEEEVGQMRKRLHDWAPHMGWVDQRRRMEESGIRRRMMDDPS